MKLWLDLSQRERFPDFLFGEELAELPPSSYRLNRRYFHFGILQELHELPVFFLQQLALLLSHILSERLQVGSPDQL